MSLYEILHMVEYNYKYCPEFFSKKSGSGTGPGAVRVLNPACMLFTFVDLQFSVL